MHPLLLSVPWERYYFLFGPHPSFQLLIGRLSSWRDRLPSISGGKGTPVLDNAFSDLPNVTVYLSFPDSERIAGVTGSHFHHLLRSFLSTLRLAPALSVSMGHSGIQGFPHRQNVWQSFWHRTARRPRE